MPYFTIADQAPESDRGYADRQQAEEAHVLRMATQVPGRIKVALNFVSLCNQSMGLRRWPNGFGGYEAEFLELHPSQEGAFRLACQALGNYFVGLPVEYQEPKLFDELEERTDVSAGRGTEPLGEDGPEQEADLPADFRGEDETGGALPGVDGQGC